MPRSHGEFLAALEQREKRVLDHLRVSPHIDRLMPAHIRDLALAYVDRQAKRLRPAVLLFSCRAAGGDEELALPAAAGVELTHTWTLTHDDLIDHDALRRGGPTVHEMAAERARQEFGYDDASSRSYGERLAILVGDVQSAWSIACLLETPVPPIRPETIRRIVLSLVSETIPDLIRGETLDVQLETADLERLSEREIVEMLWLKTGVLYRFSAMAGAMLGADTPDPESERVRPLAEFASLCGTAFQLQDDILGIMGDQEVLGKPVGSDIREGKRTTIVLHAHRHAAPEQRRFLESVLGNRDATDVQIAETKQLLQSLGGIAYTADLARNYVARALPHLEAVPPSQARDLLEAWAHFMVDRAF